MDFSDVDPLVCFFLKKTLLYVEIRHEDCFAKHFNSFVNLDVQMPPIP